MINNCLNDIPLPIYGDGMQIRDWLYVEDHCRAIDIVINNGRVGEVYNVGGHNEKTNLEIVKSIIKHVNRADGVAIDDSLIEHIIDRKGHDRRYAIDPKKIGDELNWQPKIMFEEGLKQTIKWYLDNQEWINRVVTGEYRDYYEKMYKRR